MHGSNGCSVLELARVYATRAHPPEAHHVPVQVQDDTAVYAMGRYPRGLGDLMREDVRFWARLDIFSGDASDLDRSKVPPVVAGPVCSTPEAAYEALLRIVSQQGAAFLVQDQQSIASMAHTGKAAASINGLVEVTLHLGQAAESGTRQTLRITSSAHGADEEVGASEQAEVAKFEPRLSPIGYGDWRSTGEAHARNCYVGETFACKLLGCNEAEEQRWMMQVTLDLSKKEDPEYMFAIKRATDADKAQKEGKDPKSNQVQARRRR